MKQSYQQGEKRLCIVWQKTWKDKLFPWWLHHVCKAHAVYLHNLLVWSCSLRCEFTGTALFFILVENNVASHSETLPAFVLFYEDMKLKVFMCHGIRAMSSKPYLWRQKHLLCFGFFYLFPLLWKMMLSTKLWMFHAHVCVCCGLCEFVIWTLTHRGCASCRVRLTACRSLRHGPFSSEHGGDRLKHFGIHFLGGFPYLLWQHMLDFWSFAPTFKCVFFPQML